MDAVTSLGGHELRVDDWGIDAIYSGTQKCLSCPPGLSPVSFGERALARMDARKTKLQSWYLDVSMLRKYYLAGEGGRVYHHTAPINMTYALREALAIVLEEGLENRIARHAQMHQRLRAGLEAMGLTYVPKHSLHTLNCISIPAGADDAAVRRRLLEEYGIEIGAGLGADGRQSLAHRPDGPRRHRAQRGPRPGGAARDPAVTCTHVRGRCSTAWLRCCRRNGC